MSNTSHKMPVIWATIMLAMSLLYACTDADSGGDSTSAPTLKAGDITYDYDRFAQGTQGTATPSSSTITDFSGLTFSIASISTHTGTQVPPAIAEDGIITVATDTTAGSYGITITPDGSTVKGAPITLDFYVTVKPANIGELDTTLETAIANYSPTGDFNYIDTSAMTNISYLFAPKYTPGIDGPRKADATRIYVDGFNGDISKWDVSSVKNFTAVFFNATMFNQNIGDWNVSDGTNFAYMFQGATAFNQNIFDWDVSSGQVFAGMFYEATAFNQNISWDALTNTGWDVSSGTDFSEMFQGATAFNNGGSPAIGNWNVSSGTNFLNMFYGATAFNQNIGGWNVSAGETFASMFEGATVFNQDLSGWSVNTTDDITDMFLNSGMTNLPGWYTP